LSKDDFLGRQALLVWHRPLTMDVGPDQAGFDREAFAADQSLGHAAHDGHLEKLPQQVAVAETSMPVLREGRVIGHIVFQA
jgi:hypothetical protein